MIRATFDRFDRNRDKLINVSELQDALQHLGLPTATRRTTDILKRFDQDHSGSLDLDEFAALCVELQAAQEVSGARASNGPPPLAPISMLPVRSSAAEDEIQRIFEQIDGNLSGYIDGSELRRALEALGLPLSTAQAAAALERYDLNQEARLDLNGFRALVSDMQRHVRAETHQV